MLTLNIDKTELLDEKTQKFISCEKCTLTLEHSLVSISKWEAKYHKPFIDNTEKTSEELIDYIRCMTITQNVNPNVYKIIATNKNLITTINNYIQDTMTATTFTSRRAPQPKGRSSEKMTSELIYFWMVTYNIPFDCQKWHINRLLTLIRICNIKNDSGKKMPKKDILKGNRSLNQMRRQKLGTNG